MPPARAIKIQHIKHTTPAECCPTCGRAFKRKAPTTVVDLADMTEEQLRAYYRKISPAEDVRFALRVEVELDPELAIAWTVLSADVDAGRVQRADTTRQLTILQDRWRHGRYLADMADLARTVESGRRWAQSLTIGLSLEAYEYSRALEAGAAGTAGAEERSRSCVLTLD